jgi:hypothetical protein
MGDSIIGLGPAQVDTGIPASSRPGLGRLCDPAKGP